MNGLYCVYEHTNTINGKKYIGMCRQDRIYTRWANGHGYYKQKQFGEEIKKYGWDKFDHVVLFENLKKEEAIEKESECIQLFKTYDPEHGYNISIRGDKFFINLHHSEKSKAEISKKLKQYVKTPEHRKHISEKKSGVLHHCAKKVYQYTKDGNFVKEWPYMKAAAMELSIQKGNISLCCLGKRKTAGGYIWSYERG